MRIENLLIGFVFFGLFLFAGYSLMNSNSLQYGTGADTTKLGAVSNQISPAINETKLMADTITGQDVSENTVEDGLFLGGFKAILNFFGSIGTMTNATNTIVKDINVADEHSSGLLPGVIAYLFVVLGISVAVFALYMIFRFKPQ